MGIPTIKGTSVVVVRFSNFLKTPFLKFKVLVTSKKEREELYIINGKLGKCVLKYIDFSRGLLKWDIKKWHLGPLIWDTRSNIVMHDVLFSNNVHEHRYFEF